jgi:small subunit ribosomal protein S16
MAVAIRLLRQGAKNKPRYRIVVCDSRFTTGGRSLEVLGSYNPFDKEKGLKVKVERISDWVKKGAILSNTLKKLLKNHKINL